MKRFRFNRNSLTIKLTALMLVVILLQSVFLLGGVFASGVVSSLRDYAYSVFAEKAMNRKNYLETEMIMRWSNIQSFAQAATKLYQETYDQENPEESREEYLNQVTEVAIQMMRATTTSGSFLILDEENKDSPTNMGIRIKDYDTLLNDSHNSDLFFLNGPTEISKRYQIPLDSGWGYGISLQGDTKALFDAPYEAAKNTNKTALLGYWHASASKEGQLQLSYSLPLADEQGQPFGVIGVDISQAQIYRLLPKNDLFENNPLGYVIGLLDLNTNTVVPKVMQGSMQNHLFQLEKSIDVTMVSEDYSIYKLKNQGEQMNILCHVDKLHLYSNNTPFEQQQWVLMALADEKNLVGISDKVMTTIAMACFIAILLGVVVVYCIGFTVAQPVVRLAKNVRENDPRLVVSLERTGLSEVDDLAAAIEYLNHSVLDNALKTDKIMSMVNVPIGVFEYKRDTEYVMGTAQLFELLRLSTEGVSRGMVNKEDFFAHLEMIRTTWLQEEEDDVYGIGVVNTRWIQIKTVKNEDGILGVVTDVTTAVMDKHIIQFERDYDALTGIFNRTAFQREGKKIFSRGHLGVTAFAMFDLDNLKYVNDTYGHDIGDLYIQTAGAMLARISDRHTIVARMSGDEFYVLFYGCEEKEQIRNYINLLYQSFEDNPILLPNGNLFKVRISAGISWYGKDSTDFDQLIHFADFAMYEGKHTVKGEVREFNRHAYDSESFMLSGKEELNKVLDNQMIEYEFQPIVSAKDGSVYGFEALMRPQSEMLSSPLKLIQIATAQSQLWKIEKITFFKALTTYRKYRDAFPTAKLFINSVPNQMLKDSEYRELEKQFGDMLPQVAVEIIENEKLNEERFLEKRDIVKSWGADIVLDDYGAGYNSDISLLNIAPQIVKIDRMMIVGIEKDRSRQSIIAKLISYGAERGILILAEGIETKEQMEYLIGMGVDLMQGYYIGYPVVVPQDTPEELIQEIKKAAAGEAKV